MTLDAKSHWNSTQIDGLFEQGVSYDARGRVTTVTQGARTRTYAYGADGLVASITDAAGHVVQFERDSVGPIITRIEPGSNQIGFGYDANGNLIHITPASRPTHGQTYTAVDLLLSYDPPVVAGSSTSTTYGYDLDRMLKDVFRPDGATVHREYDAMGRPQAVILPTGTITYAYSSATGLLVSVSGPYGETVTYGYDGGLLSDLVYSGTVAGNLHWGYDANFRVNSETVNSSSAAFGYDVDGLLDQAGLLTLTPDPINGLLVGTTLGNVSDTYGYNAYGEVDSYVANYAGSAIFSDDFSPRDSLGRIVTRTESVQGATHVYAFEYDVRGRLTDVRVDGLLSGHYDYDANGNRLAKVAFGVTTSGTFDTQDRLLTYGDATYTYGANGELATKTVGGQSTQYTYDALGNLIKVATPSQTIDYVVDGRGHRVQKRIGGAAVKGFLWDDGLRVIAELDGVGTLVNRFVYGMRVNVPDYMVRGADTYRLVTDHRGSVRLVVNVNDGTIVQRMDYDEFGIVTNDTNPGFQPFGFGGGLYDPDTGFVRFGVRDYDANTGRWASKDPVRFAGGMNLYGYGLNDPVNQVDSEGTGEGCRYASRFCASLPGQSEARCNCLCSADKICTLEDVCGLTISCQGNSCRAEPDAGVTECVARAAEREAACKSSCLPVCNQ